MNWRSRLFIKHTQFSTHKKRPTNFSVGLYGLMILTIILNFIFHNFVHILAYHLMIFMVNFDNQQIIVAQSASERSIDIRFSIETSLNHPTIRAVVLIPKNIVLIHCNSFHSQSFDIDIIASYMRNSIKNNSSIYNLYN